MKPVLAVIFAISAILLRANNLIPGDTSAETEFGTVVNGHFGSMIWGDRSLAERDDSTAFDGRYSVKTKAAAQYSLIQSVPLKKGQKYTFSFYAKSARDGVPGSINCALTSLPYWPPPAGEKKIRFTRDWQRYSFTFTAKQDAVYSGTYRVFSQNEIVWFDAFQLEEGETARPYAPRANLTSGVMIAEAPGDIFYTGEPQKIEVNVRRFSGRENAGLKIRIVNQRGAILAQYEKTPVFGTDNRYSFRPEFQAQRPGWYRVEAEINGQKSQRMFVVTEPAPPYDRKVMPFSAFCNMFTPTEIFLRMGQGWRNYAQGFATAAANPGELYFYGMEEVKKAREAGLFVKLMIDMNPPKRLFSKEELAGQKEHRLTDVRFVPGKSATAEWIRFMEGLVKNFGPYVDIWEFGGELDARFGLNPYYKSRYRNDLQGPFVTGALTRRIAELTRLGAECIKKAYPDARITAVRPCDVDCRSQFLFSKAVYSQLNGCADSFGLDSYAHPRKIGKGEVTPGPVTDLIQQYKMAKDVLRLSNPKADFIMISEYGYELSHESENDIKYMDQYAICYAQSNLMARAVGFSFMAYYVGLSGSGLYDNWRRNEPLASVAAVCHISRFLRNVNQAEYVIPADGIVIGCYGRTDGTAGIAMFTCNPEDVPDAVMERCKLFDIYGDPVKPAGEENGRMRFPVTYSPVLLEAGSFTQAKKLVKQMKLISGNPLAMDFRMRTPSTVKLYLTSRLSKEPVHCVFQYQGKQYEEVIQPQDYVIVNLPVAQGQSEIELSIQYPELKRVIQTKYELPEIHKIARLTQGFEVDGNPEKWKKFPAMTFDSGKLIFPIDVFSWHGPEDLSCRMNLAHDGKNFYLFAAVKDDFHFNRYQGSRIARGDHLQLAWDPLTNTFGLSKEKRRPDDTNLAIALAQGKNASLFYYGPDGKLFEKSQYAIRRAEAEKITYYELRIPLSSLGICPDTKRVFGFSGVVFDDDSNTRWDYYMNLFPGITRGNNPALYGMFVLE